MARTAAQLSQIAIVLEVMKRSLVLCCATIILLVPASTGASVTPPKKKLVRCAPRHARVIVSNSQAEVYEGPDPHREGLPAIYGCTRSGHRAYVLGEPLLVASSGIGGIVDETLAGTMVAYESVGSNALPEGGSNNTWMVLVRDLRTGKWIHRAFTGVARQSKNEGVGPVAALVVKADGSVAWVAEVAGLPERAPAEYEVHALDRSGSRLLASGTDVEPHSLALKGSTLSWKQNEQQFSTSLE
jgi:hypothetical protein